MSDRDELIRRAQGRAAAPSRDEERGYLIRLDEGSAFFGRFGGEATDETYDRQVFRFWDEQGERCFMRSYAALAREIYRCKPDVGDLIVVARGADYQSQHGTPGYSFAVEVEPSPDPLPGGSAGGDDGSAGGGEDGIPFL